MESGEFDFDGMYKRFMNDSYKKVREEESKTKQYIDFSKMELTAIKMYKRGQELKGQITELEKELNGIDDEINTVQGQNGALLPSVYKKQNIFQRMKGKIFRLIRRKEVAEVESKIGDLESRKGEIARRIKESIRKYGNLHVQNKEKFDRMTDDDINRFSYSIFRNIVADKARLRKIQSLLNNIIETGAIENNREMEGLQSLS